MAAEHHTVSERDLLRNKDLWDEQSLYKIAITGLGLLLFLKLFHSTFYVPRYWPTCFLHSYQPFETDYVLILF